MENTDIDIALAELESSMAKPKKPRKLRATAAAAIAREFEAYQKGYDAGAEAHGGTGVVMLLAGAVSGAAALGVVFALWHIFH